MARVWWVLVILLALMSVLLRHELLFLATILLALVGGAAKLWSRVCLREVHYRRTFSVNRFFFGEEADLLIEIVNAKPLPLAWLRAEDEFPRALDFAGIELSSGNLSTRRVLVNVLTLRWYERVIRRYRVRATRRGNWRIGPVDLASGDVFGFAVQRIRVAEPQEVIVYPRILPLTMLGLPARRPFGDLRTPRRLIEDPLRLAGARDYVPGDTVRHIHWKATARRRTLQTKVFDPSASRPLAICLNVNTFEYRYEGQDIALQEVAISVAASVAQWGWDNGLPVGLYVNSIAQPAAHRIRLRPSARPDRIQEVLEVLARVVTPGRWPLEAILQVEQAHFPFGATIVAISPLINDGLRRQLEELYRREYGVALLGIGDVDFGNLAPSIWRHRIAVDDGGGVELMTLGEMDGAGGRNAPVH